MRSWRFSFLLGLALPMTGAAAAEDFYPGVIGKDDRVRVGERPGPWQAIGQVNAVTYRHIQRCTGTLVAPSIVITAAHCLIDYKRRPLPLHNIHFVAGAQSGQRKNHATAKCLRFHPRFPVGQEADEPADAGADGPGAKLSHDVAAIILKETLPIEPAALAPDPLQPGDATLVHAAYPRDRRYALSAHFNCALKGVDAERALWSTECDTHPASSGGPVFLDISGQLRLGAVMVGALPRQASFAVPLSDWAELARDASCPAQ